MFFDLQGAYLDRLLINCGFSGIFKETDWRVGRPTRQSIPFKAMRLADLKEREEGILLGFEDDRLAVKLMAMGVLPGSLVRIIRKSSGGKTFYVRVDQMHLAIRKKEAECIVLK
jgi:ferrous iron transport protein A